MYDKQLSDSNYCLLSNILYCNLFLEKSQFWLNEKCDHCDKDCKDIMHLLYGCHNVKRVLKNVGKILNCSVLWKHTVMGFHEESNSKINFFNTIITHLSYTICKFRPPVA